MGCSAMTVLGQATRGIEMGRERKSKQRELYPVSMPYFPLQHKLCLSLVMQVEERGRQEEESSSYVVNYFG